MSTAPVLHWLPLDRLWRDRLKVWREDPIGDWPSAVKLANTQLDFLKTNMLDHAVREKFGASIPSGVTTEPVRLAILGSSTFSHLHSGIRMAALRRGLWVDTFECDFGQYRQELNEPSENLRAFEPDTLLFSYDANHILAEANASLSLGEAEGALIRMCERIRGCWELGRKLVRGQIIQQTIIPTAPMLMGNNEHRLAGSARNLLSRLNIILREMADKHGVDLLAMDDWIAQYGLDAFHDPALWHRSKQEVTPAAAPVYGDLIGRLLAAAQGRAAKCLVMDLDNTLWGGVVGDDGVEGLVLGPGSAVGEGFAAVQSYARELSRRGIILAVCSKNDESNALEPFLRHPEMVLTREDVSSFVANWNDKATNIRRIAEELNIGLDSLVFLDDNPMERDLVRRELPMVAVPETPEDPAMIPRCLADAGYFEGLAVTDEDRSRALLYLGNRKREEMKAEAVDMASFLKNLEMTVRWGRFDRLNLKRILQLINKTNQFNLRTRRYSEEDLVHVMENAKSFGIHLRLLDRFGDNGIVAVVIGKGEGDAIFIDTWLMSCRVLGRNMEVATLGLIVEEARRLGALRLIGEYRPSAKNGMVRDHYPKLGFEKSSTGSDGTTQYVLELAGFEPSAMYITMEFVEQKGTNS